MNIIKFKVTKLPYSFRARTFHHSRICRLTWLWLCGSFLSTKRKTNMFSAFPLSIEDLFWSDPDPRGRKGCRKNEDRKMACFFGSDITQQFLKKYNLSMLIRSHQVKQDGYEYAHDGKLLTVFSASNYCGGSNWGAVVRWFVLSLQLSKENYFDIFSRDFDEEEPWIISFKTEPFEMEKLSFSKQFVEHRILSTHLALLFISIVSGWRFSKIQLITRSLRKSWRTKVLSWKNSKNWIQIKPVRHRTKRKRFF